MKNLSFLVLLCPVVLACSAPSEAQDQTAEVLENVVVFKDVNVITMESAEVLSSKNVVIANGKIHTISDTRDVPEGALVIDANGKFLLPGLAEMHAHIPTDAAGALVEETLFLYLAGGVTTIRGMLGHPSHLTLREGVANGRVLGPHIYTSGPSINGNSAPDIATVTSMVKEQHKAGYDFLKLHPGIKREVFDALVSTANEVGIAYAGHVSRDVGIRHALKSKYATVDHLDGYVEGMVPKEAGVNPEDNGFFGMNFTDLADESFLQELINSTLENQVWVVPTQCLAERWSGPVPAAQMESAQEMKYMPQQTIERWVSSKDQMQQDPQYDEGRAQRFIDLRRRMIKAMHEAGVGILLGSDAPQVFNVPGFAILHEIEMYVAAGLSPYEAIFTGTVNPANYFHTESSRGMIKEGYEADLLLLNENPLDDITALRKKAGVMIKGHWLSQETIAARLETLATKYEKQ